MTTGMCAPWSWKTPRSFSGLPSTTRRSASAPGAMTPSSPARPSSSAPDDRRRVDDLPRRERPPRAGGTPSTGQAGAGRGDRDPKAMRTPARLASSSERRPASSTTLFFSRLSGPIPNWAPVAVDAVVGDERGDEERRLRLAMSLAVGASIRLPCSITRTPALDRARDRGPPGRRGRTRSGLKAAASSTAARISSVEYWRLSSGS